MLALELVSWWYSKGWSELASRSVNLLTGLYSYFSVSLLLKTIFSPWKMIVSYGSRSLNQRLRAMADNLVSRMVGLSVRLIVLVTALVLMLLAMTLSLVALLLWPLLPLAIPVLLIRLVWP